MIHKALLAGGLIQTSRKAGGRRRGEVHKALLAGGLIQTESPADQGRRSGGGHKALLAGGLIQTIFGITLGVVLRSHKALLAGGLIQTLDALSGYATWVTVTKPF